MLHASMSNAASSRVTRQVFLFKAAVEQLNTLSLTVDICGKIPKYNPVWLVKHSTENPVQTVVIVYEDALFGHAIRHHPDAEQKHEEEHIGHLKDKNTNTKLPILLSER